MTVQRRERLSVSILGSINSWLLPVYGYLRKRDKLSLKVTIE